MNGDGQGWAWTGAGEARVGTAARRRGMAGQGRRKVTQGDARLGGAKVRCGWDTRRGGRDTRGRARARHGMACWAANGHQVQTLMAHINPAHKGLTTLVPRSMTTLRAHSFAKWIAFIALECFK